MERENRRVTALIVRRGAVLSYDVVIPARWIGTIQGRRIILKATWQDLDRLEQFITHWDAADGAQEESSG